MTSLLIGSDKTIDVPCKALFISPGTKPTEVNFTAVFTRLSRTESKKLNKRIAGLLRQVRALGKDIMLLEHDDIAFDEQKLVIVSEADELTVLSEKEKASHREKLEAELERLEESMTSEITTNLHNIKNLKQSNNKNAEYCDELVKEMLDIEPYYIALREGLNKSNGVYQDKRTKN